jgi:hypothetical protein
MKLQVESTEDEYEMVQHGRGVAAEAHARSPATRWYTQGQALALVQEVGVTHARLTWEFTLEPAKPDDSLFCVLANRSAAESPAIPRAVLTP